MTRTTSARIAGVAFLFYIAAGLAAVVLFGRATGAEGAALLARVAGHAPEVRLAAVLTLLCSFAALVLGVTLYGITRDEDHELAVLAMTFRVAEGVLGGFSVIPMLGLLWLGTAGGASGPDAAAAHALAAYLLKGEDASPTVTATFFAVGSTLFSWLLLRGRMVPVPLAWLGVAASVLLVVGLPLRLGGVVGGPLFELVWLPMLVFEVTLAAWFLTRGVATPAAR
ncbi:MAG TPA: DUF4386 domain-containing protein [Longimicrobium sp.]|jgi:hypothetical protein